jgi:hypothetical protein
MIWPGSLVADVIAREIRLQMLERFGIGRQKSERKLSLQQQIAALESQGKYCPPEILKDLRRQLESLK